MQKKNKFKESEIMACQDYCPVNDERTCCLECKDVLYCCHTCDEVKQDKYRLNTKKKCRYWEDE